MALTGEGAAAGPARRLASVTLDERSIGRQDGPIEHERAVAITDLLAENSFAVVGHDGGPYALTLSIVENRLVFEIAEPERGPVIAHLLSLAPLRKIVRDYFMICESYNDAVQSGNPSRIEAIDMGRRGLHDEAAGLLMQRLAGKIEVDFATARRLFTLICVLHWKG